MSDPIQGSPPPAVPEWCDRAAYEIARTFNERGEKYFTDYIAIRSLTPAIIAKHAPDIGYIRVLVEEIARLQAIVRGYNEDIMIGRQILAANERKKRPEGPEDYI